MVTPVSAMTLLRHRVDARFDEIEFLLEADQRHHDFGNHGLPVLLPASTAASKMARACISAISG